MAAGALVAFQPPANAELGKRVGTLGAAFISLAISLLLIAALLSIFGGFEGLRHVTTIRPEHMLGGIAGAAIVVISLVTVRELGAGGVVAVTVCTQLIVSALLDRLGLLGLSPSSLDFPRVLGFILLIAGTILVTVRFDSA